MNIKEQSTADQTEPVDEDANAVLSVVLPTYNEAGNVEQLADEIIAVLAEDLNEYHPFEILYVNDGSTDKTLEKLEKLADEFPPIRVISLSRNFGQSAALAAGIDFSNGDIIVTMDADGQNDPADIPKLLEKFTEGYDCVSGWRKERRDPLTKRLPSAIQTRLAWLTGPNIHDFGCTLKVYHREAIQDIDLYGENHRYVPAQLYQSGYQVTEVPVNHRPREYGETKYGARRLIRGTLDLGFHIFWTRFASRPLHFLGGLGLLFISLGGIIGLHAVILKFAFGVPLTPRLPRLILVIGFILFGTQLMVFGFLAEMVTKLHYSDKKPYHVDTIIE